MRDILVRAGRTALQTFLATVVASGILAVAADGSVDLAAIQAVAVSAGVAVVAALISFAQNWLEESTSVPTVK